MRTALILGTGMDLHMAGQSWEAISPYGAAITTTVIGGERIAILKRHGPALTIPPHLINYRDNMLALRHMGIERIIATSAVGSLRKDLPPGTLAVVGDFIDFTKQRDPSIYVTPGPDVVHTDFSTPYCAEVSDAIEKAAQALDIPLARRVTYLCVDGPRYETPAEIRVFAQWGADVVGMTGIPEAVYARELGMCYGSLAISTNFVPGVGDRPISHQEVIEWVSARSQQIYNLLHRAAALIPQTHTCCLRLSGGSSV
jgi:5'-methylthioinosine phosphorylase